MKLETALLAALLGKETIKGFLELEYWEDCMEHGEEIMDQREAELAGYTQTPENEMK